MLCVGGPGNHAPPRRRAAAADGDARGRAGARARLGHAGATMRVLCGVKEGEGPSCRCRAVEWKKTCLERPKSWPTGL